MRLIVPKGLLLLLASAISSGAFAQRFNYKHYTEATNPWQRVHLSFTLPIVAIKMNYEYTGRDYYGRREHESISKTMPQHNYGVGVGTFFPLSKINDKSKLSLGLDLNVNIYNWDVVKTASYSNTAGWGISYLTVAGTQSISVPITLDYKTGCDAMQSKKYRSCFTLGGGFYPSWSMTQFYDIQGESKISIRPVVKMEAGVRFGMCFKLRAMYQMGNITYLSIEDDSPGYEEKLSFESKGTFMLSLLIIPTAFSWDRDEKY